MGPETYQPPSGHGVMEGGGCQCTERSCCWAGRCCRFFPFQDAVITRSTPEKSNFYLHLGKENFFKLGKLLENERQWQLIENTKKVQKGLS